MPKSPKEIVMAAFTYLSQITPPTQKISDVRIEELQSFKEGTEDFWSVVLSFDNTGEYPFDKKREHKKFKVTIEGEVISMTSPNNE
jgi:hypothetical protein